MNQGLGTGKPARVKRNFELSDLELSEVNLVTLWRRKFGTGRKTRVIRKFELSEFELTGFNCRWFKRSWLCIAYFQLFQTQTLSESNVFYDILGMKSTFVACAHPARHQATGDLIRQCRRTAEHLHVLLLFASDIRLDVMTLYRTAWWQ